MVWKYLTIASLTFCWMFSPDALVLLGNSAGKGGWSFILFLLLAFSVSGWAIHILQSTYRTGVSPKNYQSISSSTGMNTVVTLSLTLAYCLTLALFIPTGTLVTAGFTFNETFVYWFPNFGFSFLLLGVILLVHLWSVRLPLMLQVIFVGITLISLLVLSTIGLLSPQNSGSIPFSPSTDSATAMETLHIGFTLFSGSMLLLLGYDQTINTSLKFKERLLILTAGGLVLTLWGTASLLHIPHGKLCNSTIPYIIGAREIFGQPGRIIIGIAIISGTCGVVNGLFIFSNNCIQHLATSQSLPPAMSPILRQRAHALLLALLIGLFMASGLAGEEHLETYIYGALLLWLLHTGYRLSTSAKVNYEKSKTPLIYCFFAPTLFFLTFFFSVASYNDFKTLSRFLILALASSAAMAVCWLALGKCSKIKSTQSPQ
ncbi:MAG: APC family permease [Desulfobulbaceae bacterium]|nr:APC family permease [Desulfobulbaceae bacterium]